MKVRPALAAVAAVLATLTACASTVQESAQQSVQQSGSPQRGSGLPDATGAQPGLSRPSTSTVPGPTTGVGSLGAEPTTNAGATTATPTPGKSHSGRPRNTPRRHGSTDSGPAGTAPGVTATAIKIGVYTANGFGGFAAKFGVSVATGNMVAEANAVIAYLNAHGGLAGRKIVPVFHDLDFVGSVTNPDGEYQKACATWTQDTRVYAVVSPVGTGDDNLQACLSKAGVPLISAGDSKDASFFSKYADWSYDPDSMNLRRILSNEVDGLASSGFFGPHAKVGVVLSDTPEETSAVSHGLRPALARHGLPLAATFAAPTDASADLAYSGAVLHFKSAGVTNVIFTSAASPILFAADANSQKYYPRYGLQSTNSPSLLQGTLPARTQQGAMGIGWEPFMDVDAANDPGKVSPREASCLKLMKQAGQQISSRSTGIFGLWYCDLFYFLHDALRYAPSFSLAGLRRGAESLTHFESAAVFRSGFAPGRLHDGASAYRRFAFTTACGCYRYVSKLQPAT